MIRTTLAATTGRAPYILRIVYCIRHAVYCMLYAVYCILYEHCFFHGQQGEQRLPGKAKHWGDDSLLHWRRHKALADNDGEWLDLNMLADVGAPLFAELDSHWIRTFEELPEEVMKL